MTEPLNLVLFSGTDDKLTAASVLAAGAAALGKPVNVFLQYWALDAFRRERISLDHGLAPEAGSEGRAHVDALHAAGQATWAETFRQAKELGGIDIEACSLSMDLLGIEEDRPRPARRRRGGRDRLLPQRRRGPGRLHLNLEREPHMSTISIDQRLDAKNLSCPLPIVKTAQAMKELTSGQILEVLATDPGSVKDFAAWSKSTGHEIVEQTADGGVFRFVLRKK